MRFRLAAILAVATLVLAACTGGIPDSGSQLGQAGNYKPDTPEYFAATVGDRVFFDVDKSTLTPAAMAILDAQADWLAKNPAFNAVIEGHTDERGTREYNLALGARRAAAVKAYLVSQGVASSRLSTVTYGKERPVAICSAESCWSQNRRAVTVLRTRGTI